MVIVLGIAITGAAGVLIRYACSKALPLPLGTLTINTVGSFLIGWLAIAREAGLLRSDHSVILCVGLLGGFTTLSAFSLETIQLSRNGLWTAALTYFLATPILGVLAAGAGMAVARWVMER